LKKQHVVFEETTRRFRGNNTSFSKKQHVIFEETTRRFRRNNTSFLKKQHVTFEETTRRFRRTTRRFRRTTRRKKMEMLQNSFLQHLHWGGHEGIKARIKWKREGRE